MSTVPDRLHIDKSDREIYPIIAQETDLFQGKNNKEQFLIAMAIGVNGQIKVPLKAKDGWFLRKDLRVEDEALISAVAVTDNNSVDILSDKGKVFEVAEQYAHAGIRMLADNIESVEFGTFSKQFEKQISEVYAKNSKNDKASNK